MFFCSYKIQSIDDYCRVSVRVPPACGRWWGWTRPEGVHSQWLLHTLGASDNPSHACTHPNIFILSLVIEGKALMSREPGICDPYVKVYDELDGGGVWVGWGAVRSRVTRPCPQVSAHLWAWGHSRWQGPPHYLASRHLLGPVMRCCARIGPPLSPGWFLSLPARAGILGLTLVICTGEHRERVGDGSPQITPSPLMKSKIFTPLPDKTRSNMARFGWWMQGSVSEA